VFTFLVILGIISFLVIVFTVQYYEPWIDGDGPVYVFLVSLIILILSIVSGIIGTRTVKTKYEKAKITQIIEHKDTLVILLEDGKILTKKELKWRDKNRIFKKIEIDRFGDEDEEYVVK